MPCGMIADFIDEDGNKVHRNDALAKKYMTGIYGGIPYLKPIQMFTDVKTEE